VNIEELAQLVYKELGMQTEMGKEYLIEILMAAQTFDKKQQDYGSGNISAFGEVGVMVRINDKIARLRNLLWTNMVSGKVPSNEAVEDTWQDLHVYGGIGLLCHKGKWK
jgi:hypothetical protein